MTLFLPEDQIKSVFNQLEVRDLPLSEVHMNQYAITYTYNIYKVRQGIISIPRNELSIFTCQLFYSGSFLLHYTTNNGAENYHRTSRVGYRLEPLTGQPRSLYDPFNIIYVQ